MLTKFACAAAVAASVAGFAITAEPAKAGSPDVTFSIGIGVPAFHPGYGYGHGDGYYYGRPVWEPPYYGRPVHRDRWHARISCREGAWSARSEGFHRVRPLDCNGRSYSYRGFRDGTAWKIRVSASTGDVIGARPVRH